MLLLKNKKQLILETCFLLNIFYFLHKTKLKIILLNPKHTFFSHIITINRQIERCKYSRDYKIYTKGGLFILLII